MIIKAWVINLKNLYLGAAPRPWTPRARVIRPPFAPRTRRGTSSTSSSPTDARAPASASTIGKLAFIFTGQTSEISLCATQVLLSTCVSFLSFDNYIQLSLSNCIFSESYVSVFKQFGFFLSFLLLCTELDVGFQLQIVCICFLHFVARILQDHKTYIVQDVLSLLAMPTYCWHPRHYCL